MHASSWVVHDGMDVHQGVANRSGHALSLTGLREKDLPAS